MGPELKPCPFCGSKSVKLFEVMPLFGEPVNYNVVCEFCGCRTAKFDNKEIAITIWEVRVTDGMDN